jgi:hypothetical protein
MLCKQALPMHRQDWTLARSAHAPTHTDNIRHEMHASRSSRRAKQRSSAARAALATSETAALGHQRDQ